MGAKKKFSGAVVLPVAPKPSEDAAPFIFFESDVQKEKCDLIDWVKSLPIN
jgi:hypothetical protein